MVGFTRLARSRSLKSTGYMFQPYTICRLLFMQRTAMVLALARASAGSSIAARMAMMAITTRSSMRVKAFERRDLILCVVTIYRSEPKFQIRANVLRRAPHCDAPPGWFKLGFADHQRARKYCCVPLGG